MDLLFQRYANPFILINQMINAHRFDEFVSEILDIKQNEIDSKEIWELYLHHTFLDKTLADFKSQCGISDHKIKPVEKVNFETVVKESVSILEGFKPEE